jgi:hypothetical protein
VSGIHSSSADEGVYGRKPVVASCVGVDGEEAINVDVDVDVETEMDIDQLPSPPTPLLFPPGLPQPISPPKTEA